MEIVFDIPSAFELGLTKKRIPNFSSSIVWTPGGNYVHKDLRSWKNVNKTAKFM